MVFESNTTDFESNTTDFGQIPQILSGWFGWRVVLEEKEFDEKEFEEKKEKKRIWFSQEMKTQLKKSKNVEEVTYNKRVARIWTVWDPGCRFKTPIFRRGAQRTETESPLFLL